MPGMSMSDYNILVAHIVENHGWRSKDAWSGPRPPIKYIRHSFDTRTNVVYSVTLDSNEFTVVNENRKRDLKRWIHCWLDGSSDGFDSKRDDPEFWNLPTS